MADGTEWKSFGPTPTGLSPDLIGGSASQSALVQNQAQDETIGQQVKRGYQNAVDPMVGYLSRMFVEPDKDFNLDNRWNDLTKDIPLEYQMDFRSVRSETEGQLLRLQIQRDLENQKLLSNAGFSGTVAQVLGQMGDPTMYIGYGAARSALRTRALLSSTALDGTRLGSIAENAVAGGVAVGGQQTVRASVNPVGDDWATLPDAVLSGMVFGGAIGGVLPTNSAVRAQSALNGVKEELSAQHEMGIPVNRGDRPVRKSTEQEMADLEANFDRAGMPESERPAFEAKMNELSKRRIEELKNNATDSVGAASQRTAPLDPKFRNDDTKTLLDEVRKANVRDGLTGDVWDIDSYFKKNIPSQAAKKLYEAVNKTPWASDFDTLYNSGSVIGQRMATQLFESPSGVGQMKNRTSAILQAQYQTEIMAPVAEKYSSQFARWMQEQQSKAPTELAWNDLNMRQRFDRSVMEELQSRYFDGGPSPRSSKAIQEMADAIDEASARAASILRGREGEIPVHGAEALDATSGWYRQVWSGGNIMKAIARAEEQGAKNGKTLIKKALAQAYQQIHKWDSEIADKVAGAVLNNAIARESGTNTNLFRTMTNDNGEYLRQVLKNDGLSDKYVDELMARIKVDKAERGKIKPLKQRNDVDLRTPIPGTDMTLMDLVEADINKTWTQYARTSAGAAATARNGVQAHEIASRWIPAIKDELQARGLKQLPDGFYEALDTYFSGRAYSNGINPWLRRMLSTTNLAFLNSLGVTQMGELGAGIAAMKLDNFIHGMPEELKYIFNGKLSPVHKDLKYIDSSIIGDFNIYRPELMQNEMRNGVTTSELSRNLDSLLAKGMRTQGFISGFYKVNQWMQRMSGNTLINRVQQMANGRAMDELRMQSLGFTPKNTDRILKYFRDGTVEMKDGRVYDLHVDKWNPADFQEFGAIINRASGQSVQKAFRGEDAWWMHKDLGAFLMHLKSFTFTAVHKQLIRNMRIADSESLMTYLFGLGTAAAAYTARQYLSGNQEKMDGERLIKGMLNYSNITAPIVSFTDPVFGVLGMNTLQVGNYGNAYSGNNSLLSMPPSFNAVNRIAGIPAAVARGVTPGLNMTKQDIYALQATPLLGNLYGMGYIANAMRDDIDRKKRADKAKQELDKQAQGTKSSSPSEKRTQKSDNGYTPGTPKDVLNQVSKMGGGE